MSLIKKTIYYINHAGLLYTAKKIFAYPREFYKRQQANRNIFTLESIEDRFTRIYDTNYWGENESISGNGSTLQYTKDLRSNLPVLFNKFSIKSIFDAPCGDFNWMKMVIQENPIEYIGGDIVKPLINENKNKYEGISVKFIHIDLTDKQFPKVDLMLCRDCLFHLSYNDIMLVLENFLKSEIKYLLTSSHNNTQNIFINRDISTGDFRKIDLFKPPFQFPNEPLFKIKDWVHPEPERELYLWDKSQINEALNNFKKNIS
jgi:hypothetical protein